MQTDYPSIREADAAGLDGSLYATSPRGPGVNLVLNFAGERAAREQGLKIVGKWDEHIKTRDIIVRRFWCEKEVRLEAAE